ncbi:amino acid adenylation domain-containing protein, partial [bacterium]|nr:amino acid adenylation domain-containing protein [bacterium]
MAHANDKRSVNYNISSAYTIYGEINYAQLKKSVIAVFEKHFLFRCRFQLKDELIFEPQFDLNWFYFFEDYSECSAEEKKLKIAQTMQVEMRYEFDVSLAPLVRVTCIKTAASESILILTMHHLISDGVSFVLFIEDLVDEYFSSHEPMAERRTPQFSDYLINTASAYTAEQFERVVSYWQQQVKQLETLELPYDFSHPKLQQFTGDVYRTVLSETLQSKLKQYSQHQGVTLFMCMLSAYAMLLHRYTGQTHFCVGTPVNLRRKLDARVIGPCINMLPLAFEITSVDTFADSLQKVKLALLTALEHRYIPLDTLVEQLEIPYDASRNPLFQTIFVWQNLANGRFEQEGLCFEPLETHHGFVKLDLEFYVKETNNQLHLYCEYKSSLFSAETIEVMVQQYIDLLKQAVGESITPSLSYAPTPVSCFRAHSVVQLFEEQVLANPTKTCIVYDDALGQQRSLSYDQFNCKVNQLAHSLQTKIDKQSIIAIVFERSLEMMLSIYAISKLGSSYLPIDPSWPIERIKEVLLDASPELILSHNACAHLLDRPFLDVTLNDCDDLNSDNLSPLKALETLPAYVIYTSGSTGKPKGVVNTHFALINRLLWMRDACKVTPNDTILQKTPYSFDVSVWEIFLPLITGSTLIIPPPGSHRDCLWLQQIILQNHVTMLHFVPSMLNAYLADRDPLLKESLRVVICSGEELLVNTVDDFYQIFKQVELYNLYGPTEACIDVTYWQCQANYGRKIPIGKPISNTQIYILDQQLNPVPTLAKGEIYIAGVNLALGYLNQPALTAERFFEHVFADGRCERLYKTGDYGRYTPDGLIVYLGRVDDMIKLNGNRIELAEIEAKLSAHPNVKNAAVIVKASQEPSAVTCLVAFVELVDSKQATNEQVLKTYLSSRLPLYMLCSVITILDQMPQTSSGKIDKKTLQAMKLQWDEALHVDVVTKAEFILHDAWAATLRKDTISRFDNFFKLGGDSIRIMQMLSLLRKQGIRLSVQQVYTCENLSELAKYMVFEQSLENNHMLPPFSLMQRNAHLAHEDAYPLSLLQQAIYYFQQERKYAYHVYATWYLIESKFDLQLLQSAVDQVVNRHPILKSHIDTVNYTEWVQVVLNDVQVKINSFDLSFLDTETAKDYMAIWLQDDQSTPFDWSLSPLLRVSVHQLANQQFYLTLTEPWLDGWSVSIVGQEILTIYAGLLEHKPIILPALSTNYAYYVQQERLAAQDETHKRFWHDYLKDAEPCYLERVEFDTNQRFKTHRQSIVFPEQYLVHIKQIASTLNVSIKHVLLAAHLFLMRFLTGKNEIITGLMSNARPETVGVEQVVGLFLNAVPFRMQVKNQSWANLIKAVYAQESQLMPHRFYPSAQIRQDHANTALFNTLFNFTDFHLYRDVPNTPQFALKDVFGNDQTYYLLTCHFSISFNGQYLKLDLDSNQNCDSIAWLNDMTQCYQTILDLMSTDSESLCQDFYLTYRYPSGLEGEYLPISNDRLIDYFTQHVQNSPHQIAIIEKNQTYTYQDLSIVVANLIQKIARVMPIEQV